MRPLFLLNKLRFFRFFGFFKRFGSYRFGRRDGLFFVIASRSVADSVKDGDRTESEDDEKAHGQPGDQQNGCDRPMQYAP
jgi:hypothetical protein